MIGERAYTQKLELYTNDRGSVILGRFGGKNSVRFVFMPPFPPVFFLLLVDVVGGGHVRPVLVVVIVGNEDNHV